MKKFWNAVSTVLIVLLVLILLFNLICYVKRRVTGDNCPTVLGLGMAVVVTGSMEPNVSVDDLVVIWRQDEYQVRDVITYRGENYPVTHRVIAVRTDENGNVWYTTQGDANNHNDGEIAADRVVGKVVMTVAHVGDLQRFLQSTQGFVTLSITVAALIAFCEVLRYLRNKK